MNTQRNDSHFTGKLNAHGKTISKTKFTPNKYKKIEWSEFMDIKSTY